MIIRYAMSWATDDDEFVYVSPIESDKGNWVKYEDYARLQQERVRLRASSFVTAVPVEQYEKLKAEVERLKAVSTIEQRTIQGLQQTPEWSEIARLTAECRRLEAELARLRASSFVTAVPVEQYERLRKAGDRMAAALNGEYNHELPCVEEWNAAKEGKPSETKSPSFIEDLGNGVEKHDLLFRYPAKEGKPSV